MGAAGKWIGKKLSFKDWKVADLCRHMDAIAVESGREKGPTNQAVHAIIKGRTKHPEEHTLRMIALALDEDPAELLALAGHPVNPSPPRAVEGSEYHTPYTRAIDGIYRDLVGDTQEIADDYLEQTVRFLESLRQRSLAGDQVPRRSKPAIRADTA